MVSVRAKQPVECGVDGAASDPLVVFDMDTLGIDGSKFLSEIAPTFEQLEWDYYDVRREQLALLANHIPNEARFAPLSRQFYMGDIHLEDFVAELPPVSVETRDRLDAVRPYRRRRTVNLELDRSPEGMWNVARMLDAPIAQSVESTDYRAIPRKFEELSPAVLAHPDFVLLLHSIGELVNEAEGGATRLHITCWQTGVVSNGDAPASNAPEGIHQDGAHYIISALVAERKNVVGGTSRVFGPDKETRILEVTLDPGQGIFQADAGSSLWHDVTPIRRSESNAPGVRNLFGFDINVLEGRKRRSGNSEES